MQRDIIIKGRSLGGSSDLTLLAPIRKGFIDSLESVTYKTRIKRVLDTLHGARMASHEHATAQFLSDSVERVGAIHSVRVAVLEPEDNVLLAVTFDGSWESYIRVLWDKVGTLLDLIFCGTVDYVTAREHTFEEWERWARRVQVETGFFYGSPGSTARDALYHRRLERMRVRGLADELNELRAVLPSAEEATARLANPLNPPPPDDPPVTPVDAPRMVRERIRNGLQGLAGLYRLTDLHRPGTPDGDVLRFAAIDLLLEFVHMHDCLLIDKELEDERVRFERQLDWLFPADGAPALVKRQVPAPPEGPFAVPSAIRGDVQGGILQPYNRITHGVIVMLAFDNAMAVDSLLSAIDGLGGLTADEDPHDAGPGVVFRNFALTLAGLRVAGLSEDELELFPEEFRQGMAARAGLLGDVRNNHPRRWRLPRRKDSHNASDLVELDSVHAVLQLRCQADGTEPPDIEQNDLTHPALQRELDRLAGTPGVRLLAVQTLRRRYIDRGNRTDIAQLGEPAGTIVELDAAQEPVIVEHFRYADGDGQPELEWQPNAVNFKRNRIHLGEILVGCTNAADGPVNPSDPNRPEAVRSRDYWLTNGSFLVMRKYRQFADRLDQAVTRTAEQMRAKLGGKLETLKEIVYGYLMGRSRNGTPLVPVVNDPRHLNAFTYDQDPSGQQCPLQAHIRLAHPRMPPGASSRPPRLMRRSMAYGPAGRDDKEHGLVFMAYNASLSEQFEVVQRWLVGGNSTGTSSGQSCPIVGVPENGLARYFRFEHKEQVFRVELEHGIAQFELPPVVTQLEWGMYLFTPSLTALQRLRALARAPLGSAQVRKVPWRLERGRELILELKQIESEQGSTAAAEAWKAALEDPESIDRLDAAAIWAEIRHNHGGVLKTPYGTLVASRELVSKVFMDPDEKYSVSGQFERMKRSFGEISLGLDAGPQYHEQSDPINEAIGELTSTKAGKVGIFWIASDAVDKKLTAILEKAMEQALKVRDSRFEVGFDVRELVDEVLADLSEAWFGLKDDPGKRFRRGSADWKWKPGNPPLYPGHFTALSRYMFQPNPGPTPTALGESYGQALRTAMVQFVEDHRRANPGAPTPLAPDKQPAPIAHATFNHPIYKNDDDFIARNMVGVLMGFNPTIIGAVLNVVREWQRDGRFGTLRTQLAGSMGYADAHKVLVQPMREAAQMRPMPQIGWRTARKADQLGTIEAGPVDVAVGDKIVLGTVSATQQSLADGLDDGRLMFGGVRKPKGTPHPTHACPGYEAGIEAMLGALSALLAWPGTMRPGPAPLTFLLEGASISAEALAEALKSRASSREAARAEDLQDDRAQGVGPQSSARQSPAAGGTALPDSIAEQRANPPPKRPRVNPPARRNNKGFVLAWGDSWLDHSYAEEKWGTDLRDCLEEFGYRVPEKFCQYPVWLKAKYLARSPGAFCEYLESALLSPDRPIALLISAGGNDSTEETLARMLNPKGSVYALDPAKRKAHIDDLRTSYHTILTAIEVVLQSQGFQDSIPVLVHGYDYPIPRGRSKDNMGYAKKWLHDPFTSKGYKLEGKQVDLPAASAVMVELIDDLNKMLSALHQRFPFVRYVNLCGTIEEALLPGPDGVDWLDDLHPTSAAFTLLAAKIDQTIRQSRAAIAAATGPAPARGAPSSTSSRKLRKLARPKPALQRAGPNRR